ncbi:MAG TPA: hypothetical protein VMX35_03035 [Acidobacteriota bacterium]|nr:hypothetical protein [Acidobacteriota bacterium]
MEERDAQEFSPMHLRGRFLFDSRAGYNLLSDRHHAGAVVKSIPITDEYDIDSFRQAHGESAVPMFVVSDDGKLIVKTADVELAPKKGQVLIALVNHGA